jgi:hypothetical protein
MPHGSRGLLIAMLLAGCPPVDLGSDVDGGGGGLAASGGGMAAGGGAATGGGTTSGGGSSSGGGLATGGGIAPAGGGVQGGGAGGGIAGGSGGGATGGGSTLNLPDAGPVCTPEGWCWDYPTPVGIGFHAVWVASDNEAWAVGEGGLAYHLLNGQWTLLRTGTLATLWAVYGFAPNDVWAVGANGAATHWDGASWQVQQSGLDTETLRSLWGTDSAHLWAGGQRADGQLHAEIDFFDGGSWGLNPVNTLHAINDVWGTSANDVWFLDAWGKLWHYDGVGVPQQWSTFEPNASPQLGLWGASPGSYWAGTSNTTLLHFDGGTWSVASDLGPGNQLQTLWGTSDNDFWGLDYAHNVFYHFASGTQWTTIPSPYPYTTSAIHGSSPSNVWSVGGTGALLHWDGNSWSQVAPREHQFDYFTGIWAASRDDAWATGGYGLSHWDGASWTLQTIDGGLGAGPVIAGAASDDIWVVAGTIALHYDGHQWTNHVEGLGSHFIYSVWPAGDGTAYGADWTTNVFQWTSATGWSQVEVMPTCCNVVDGITLWGSGPNDVYAGSRNGIVHWDGQTWGLAPGAILPAKADTIFGLAANDVYDWDTSSGLFHFDGTSWSLLAPALNGARPRAFVTSGVDDVWAFDESLLSLAIPAASAARAFHWDGAQWNTVPVPLDMIGGAAMPDPHLIWLVGTGEIVRMNR